MYKAYQVYFIAPGVNGTINIIDREENLDNRMKEYGKTESVSRLDSTTLYRGNYDNKSRTTAYTITEVPFSKIKISDLSAQDILNLLKMNN